MSDELAGKNSHTKPSTIPEDHMSSLYTLKTSSCVTGSVNPFGRFVRPFSSRYIVTFHDWKVPQRGALSIISCSCKARVDQLSP